MAVKNSYSGEIFRFDTIKAYQRQLLKTTKKH